MDFEAYPKIPRLSRDCIITEKIDGTNGQVYIVPRGVYVTGLFDTEHCIQLDEHWMFIGSRNRWLSEKADNHGFFKWCRDHAIELQVQLGLGRHFGEWWGQGINGRYKGAPKTFSLFNAGRWTLEAKEGRLTVCSVVPILHEGMFDTAMIQLAMTALRTTGSWVWKGAEAEGIVIYHTAAAMVFKKTLKGDEKPKGQVTNE